MSALKLCNNTVHVWTLDLISLERKLSFFYHLLSSFEKEEANRFKFKKDKKTFICSRGSLRILSSKYLNIAPKEIAFKYGEFGKPEFDCKTNIKFNISHSREIIAMAFTNNFDIGIDVEFINNDFDVLDIVNNYFSQQEIKALSDFPKTLQTEAFYRGWTRKEAFIKAKAKGLSFPLHTFSISIDSNEKAHLYETLWDSNEKELWHIVPFETAPDYKAAVAVKGKVNTIRYFEFNLSKILE